MSAKTFSPGCENKEPRLKCRHLVVLFAFAAEFYFYALRINMGVSIVPMVNQSALPQEEVKKSNSCRNLMTNASDAVVVEQLGKEDGEFVWSPEFQGYILGSSFLAYCLATAPSGKLTEMFGPKNIMFVCFFFSTLFTFVSPFAAWCNVYLFIVVQCLRGLSQAGFVPSQSALIANWCPKSERSFAYTIILSGSCWGAVLGSYITGLLCEIPLLRGWPIGFFFFGGTGLIVSLLMGLFMYDNPSEHPRISPAELKNITENQENVLTKKRPRTPWCTLFTSIPVYALAVGYFGQMWALSHFLTVHPTFLGTIMHYPIKKNGLFSALPFLLQFLMTVGSGWVSKIATNKNYMSIDTARKFWNFLSCFGYSGCLLGIYFAGCNRSIVVVLSILSLAFTGFGYAGCWVAPLDMSPTFTASINAVACTLGFTSNFIMPVVVGFLTDGKQTLEQWHRILFISIGVVMSSGIIFAVFGSAKIQPWNDVKENVEQKEESRF